MQAPEAIVTNMSGRAVAAPDEVKKQLQMTQVVLLPMSSSLDSPSISGASLHACLLHVQEWVR